MGAALFRVLLAFMDSCCWRSELRRRIRPSGKGPIRAPDSEPFPWGILTALTIVGAALPALAPGYLSLAG